MFKIVKREEMSEGNVILNEIEAPKIARKAKPGQFVILKANEDGERIPLTMAETDVEKGTITVIYMIVGKSTALFKTLQVGDAYQDVIGPLGKPTHIEKLGKVVCVGGGTGIAVLHPITRAMKDAGNHVISIIGARSKDLLILEDHMTAASHDLRVCTDDGSYGHHGFVTDVLKEILEAEKIDQVVAIGPVPMMKFVSLITKDFNVPTLVSLSYLTHLVGPDAADLTLGGGVLSFRIFEFGLFGVLLAIDHFSRRRVFHLQKIPVATQTVREDDSQHRQDVLEEAEVFTF